MIIFLKSWNPVFQRTRTLQPFLLEDGTTISYGGMNARAAQIANLLGDLGAQVGDRVAVQVEKTPEAVMLYLGCLRAGLIYLPAQHSVYAVRSRIFPW